MTWLRQIDAAELALAILTTLTQTHDDSSKNRRQDAAGAGPLRLLPRTAASALFLADVEKRSAAVAAADLGKATEA
jgi:hypothetical protein